MLTSTAPRTRRTAIAAATGLTAALALGVTSAAGNAHAAATALPTSAVSPYLYLGWGSPPSPTSVMSATGIKNFTLAFILSDGGCNPKWDGTRPLTGGNDQARINEIRNAGGGVTVSVGGYSGNKLGQKCTSASALAGAYQKVIDAYSLKALDIDIEAGEFSSATVRQRVVDALKIIRTDNDSSLKIYVTFGTTPTGPDSAGKDLINKGAAAGLDLNAWAVMPFDYDQGGTTDMLATTKSAVDGLKNAVAGAYGLSSDAAYRKVGLSSMNGKTDSAGETVSLSNFKSIVSYANSHHLARVSFWAVNRDRQCGSGDSAGDTCSGITQNTYDFTKALTAFTG